MEDRVLTPVELAAQKVLYSLYDLDHLMWQAKDIHERADFGSHLVEMKHHSFYTNDFTNDADDVFEAFPALAMLRLGIIVEDCVKLICDVLHPEWKIEAEGVRGKLRAIQERHELDVNALIKVWTARSKVAHNSSAVITWEELDEHSKATWKFINAFANLSEPKPFLPPAESVPRV